MRELSQKVLAEARLRLYFETIEVNHFDYLLEVCGIGEAYDALPLNLRQVQSSLLRARLNIEPDDDKDDIANKLTIEFLSTGVKFLYMSDAELEDKGISRHEQEGIFSSEFKPDTYSIDIYITNTFIENLSLDAGPKLLAPAVLASIKHEDTHKQQYKLSRGKVKGLKTNTSARELNLQGKEHIKEYLSLPSEIDAHAREFALWLTKLNWSSKQIQNAIKNNDPILLNCLSYKIYWENFGIMMSYGGTSDEDILEKIIIWKNFLHKAIIYLQTEMRYQFSLENDFF